MAVEVVDPTSRKALIEFIRMAWRVYRYDTRWVPPIVVDYLQFLRPDKNPFFKHAEGVYFLSRDAKGRPQGRIAVIIDHNYEEFHGERMGAFGFFEVVKDYAVAQELLDAALEWLREREVEVVRGPLSFSMNHECGLLIEGFNESPLIMMPYNPQYYQEFLERYGFVKAKDLHAYWIDAWKEVPPSALRLAERLQERHGFRIRKVNVRRFNEELERFIAVYNEAWEDNWGFVPLDRDEMVYMAKRLRPLIVPDLALIAEAPDEEPAAVCLSLPDYNQVFRRMGGSLFPLGIFKFYFYSRHISQARLMALGVRRAFRNRGLELLLSLHSLEAGRKRGYHGGELSWTLEDNHAINSFIEKLGGELYKKYRIYEMGLLS
ncbi:MAG TPA: N-acetyltransferase [Thermosulfidibacter takaii]|uniref:N-acetyltransferase n=1 Tax=Thermosulfidibacter takaii TaxID=412593 RepID=A0A7C0U6S3_9BACT|nr:N-acetyltransferase [Thermosulfidibacter takaii]